MSLAYELRDVARRESRFAQAAAVAQRDLDWQVVYVAMLVAVDAVAMSLGASLAVLGRFGGSASAPTGLSYHLIVGGLVPLWVVVMLLSRAYEPRFLGVGSDEFKRVFNGAVRFAALVATLSYATRFELARGFVALALPMATAGSLVGRYAARRVLHAARARGLASHRVVVVGDGPTALALVQRLRATPHAGLQVLGVCVPGGRREDLLGDPTVPVFGSLSNVKTALMRAGADTVAVAHSPGITPEVLRRLSWDLEGSGIALVVAPALTDVAGPRVNIRPVAGLPLLHVEEPEFTGVRRVLKGSMDRLGAALLLMLSAPVLIGIALLVRLTSRGPALFRQTRVGRDGREFSLYKFRTMYVDAERRRADLADQNERSEGLLFKMRDDPRITRIGRHLRRYSLDEMPQLVNVLRGQMSLVGPRPPLPSEVAQYDNRVGRRLLVKPGMTGLWQVSGRSDLAWNETVRLDLYYVENWSPAMDFMILWKTAWAVIRGTGAY